MAQVENKKTNFEILTQELGLNSVYRQIIKRMDIGLSAFNRPDSIIDREGLSEAERCFLDPQVSTCFLLLAFSLMKKEIKFKPIEEGLKKDINKSKKLAEFLNFTLKKLADGGEKQLIFDMFTAKFFGWSLIEKVYKLLELNQSKKFNGLYYYDYCPAKRIGLWDFVYNDAGRVIGYKSLKQPDITFDKSKFIRISYLPLWNNPNGTPDFSRVWKFWNAKVEFIVFLLELGARLSKGRQAVLQNTGTVGTQSSEEIDGLLEKLAENLNVYIPQGFELQLHNFDVGALQYFIQVLKWLDSQIAIAMIGSSLAVNESMGAGTNAQSAVHTENKYTFEDYIESIITDELEESYARDLLKLNYSNEEYPEEIYPCCELVNKSNVKDKLDKANFYQILKNMGVLDTDTYTDLSFLRSEFELPENKELFDMVESIVNSALEKSPTDLNQDNQLNTGSSDTQTATADNSVTAMYG